MKFYHFFLSPFKIKWQNWKIYFMKEWNEKYPNDMLLLRLTCFNIQFNCSFTQVYSTQMLQKYRNSMYKYFFIRHTTYLTYYFRDI